MSPHLICLELGPNPFNGQINPNPIHRLAIKGFWTRTPDISSGGSFRSSGLGHSLGSPEILNLENLLPHCVSYYIFEQVSPPGDKHILRLQPSVGYRWIPLDPQGPKTWEVFRISGPDHRGRRRQVPGGPQQGRHQGLIFGQSC